MRTGDPIASTPPTPYYSVVFTSRRSDGDAQAAYEATAQRMFELASQQNGYLGFQSVRDFSGTGIAVSYWRDLDAIRSWHDVKKTRTAQESGRSKWYDCYVVRICRVEREYGFGR